MNPAIPIAAMKWIDRADCRPPNTSTSAIAFRHAGVADSGIGYCLHDYDRRGLDKFAYGRIRRYIRFCVGLAS